MTRGDIISMARNGLKMVNADYKIPNKYIWNVVVKHMRWLIKRESDKLKIVSYETLFQSLKCVEVIEAPAIDPCCGVSSKCTVFRTKERLPAIYESGSGVIIKNVYAIDMSQEFIQITPAEYIRKTENPNSKYDKNVYFYYYDGYLYFPATRIKAVIVYAYFEDDISHLNDCNDTDKKDHCRSKLDYPAGIPDGVLGEVMNFVMQELGVQRQVQGDQQIDKNEINIR